MAQKYKERGFIELIVIVILLVVIVSLLGVSLTSLVSNKTLKENFALLWQGVVWLWQHYIASLWSLFRSYIIIPIWNRF
ncbi:MAG: hypothetical protein HYT34_00705 [Candidatus Ryanbacteria bacterium]|nr:hypothetical protein [Candidatus Ryanbacteria bacterium]